jgi:DNA-binding transcriptional LysR family regulator
MTSYHWYEVNMPDQIKSMRVFLAVVATRSFSAAGRQLGMSQAMATKHISGLEQMLGVQLLRRTTRFVVATEAGERFAEASRRVIEEFDEATAVTRAGQGEPRGLLRMNVPVSFGLRVINPIIGDFAERHPSLAIDLELNDRRVDLIEGGWDLAVRVGELADSPLVARKLMDCPTRVCAAPAYLARHGTPRTVADLARHACLGYSLSDVTNAQRWTFGGHKGVVVEVTGPFRANNGDAVIAMAKAGHGIAYQPGFLVDDDLRSGALVALELDHPTSVMHAYALFARARWQPAKVRAMIDFLVERL